MLASALVLNTLRLGVVVPTLDEEAALEACLASTLPWADDLVVSDGGSSDATLEIARRLGVRAIAGPAGRGGQLNRGAVEVDGDVLVFLHADTRLPADAGDAIRRAVERGAVGGAFCVEFDAGRPIDRLGAWLVNQRTRLFEVPLGDQVHFATRLAFDAVGGFRDWPILEDLDFIRRLRGHGRLTVLAGPALTSSRRFAHHGRLATVGRNWLIWLLWSLGVSPARLARLYRHVR